MLKHLLLSICVIIVAGVTIIALLPGPSGAQHDLAGITWYTEEYPPYNYGEDGVPKGIAVDVLRKVLKESGVGPAEADIRVGSWSEGYQTVLSTPMTALFSTARTPERENLFKWAGPVFVSRNVLFAAKDANVSVSHPQDIGRLRIGIIRDDVAGDDLLAIGVAPRGWVVATRATEMVSLLEKGGIDAWAYAELPGEEIIRKHASDPGQYEIVYTLGTWEYYYAFNRDVPDTIVSEFQAGLDRMMQERGTPSLQSSGA